MTAPRYGPSSCFNALRPGANSSSAGTAFDTGRWSWQPIPGALPTVDIRGPGRRSTWPSRKPARVQLLCEALTGIITPSRRTTARRVGAQVGPLIPTSCSRSPTASLGLRTPVPAQRRRPAHRLPVQLETLRRQRVMVVAPHGRRGHRLRRSAAAAPNLQARCASSSSRTARARSTTGLARNRATSGAEMMKVHVLALGSVVSGLRRRLADESRSGDRLPPGGRAADIPAGPGALPVPCRRSRRPPGHRRRVALA